MELPKLIEEKIKEVQGLKVKLDNIRSDLEKIREKFPPIWSGNVKELNKFITDLEKWIRNPKVKRVRDLIEDLKQKAKDTRSFTGLSEEYLVRSLDSLESAAALITEIVNDSLKANAAKRILDTIHEEKDFKDLLEAIRQYWVSFRTFEETKAENEFIVAVKGDLTVSLIKGDEFSVEQVTSARAKLEKASRALELLAGSGITIQAYNETYKGLKDVDKVWEYADNIRNLLSRAFQLTKEIGEPFKEIADLLSLRMQCISKNTLGGIYEGLKENDNKINQSIEKFEEMAKEEYNKVKALVEFAELENEVDQLFIDLVAHLKTLNIDNSYEAYKKLQEIENKAIKVLEGKISENERKIIEDMGKANELIDEMGDTFWEAIKSLRGKQLIRIILERSA